MKYKITENEDTSFNRGHSRSELDLLLTPLEGKTVDDVVKALENRDYYGEYLISTRNKRQVEDAITRHFGPNLPTLKRPLEKKQGFPFPPKTKQAMEDLIRSFDSKPDLLTYEVNREKNNILFPTDKNNSQVTTTNILKTVLGNAGIKYRLDRFEDLREHRQISRMQQLAGIKEIKVNNPMPVEWYDLKKGKTYDFTYKLSYMNNGAEQRGPLTFLFQDSVGEPGEKFIIVTHPGGDFTDSFELYPEDIISIRRI